MDVRHPRQTRRPEDGDGVGARDGLQPPTQASRKPEREATHSSAAKPEKEMIYYLPSLTILLFFACLLAYEYIRDLRRELTAAKADARSAWHLYEIASRELSNLKGTQTFDPYLSEAKSQKDAGAAPFVPTGIGPTA